MNGRLTRTWLLVVVLTLLAMGVAVTGRGVSFGLAGGAGILALSGVKAGAVLRNFLELRMAPVGWQAVFYAYIAAIGALVLAAAAADGLIQLP
jgi:hypothetical protein